MVRLRPEQRERRGTASQFPAQRGYGEPSNSNELFSVETAVKQPALYPLFRLQPNGIKCHNNVYQILILLIKILSVQGGLVPPPLLVSVPLCET